MRWGSASDYSSKASPRVIRTLPGPVRPHRLDRAGRRLLLLPLPRPHSPLSFPEPIPFRRCLPASSSSSTEAELSVHSPQNPLAALSPLGNNSHRPSTALEGGGWVVLEVVESAGSGGGGGGGCSAPTRLRETLCSQPPQPSSLSQQPIKSSSWRVRWRWGRNRIPALLHLTGFLSLRPDPELPAAPENTQLASI